MLISKLTSHFSPSFVHAAMEHAAHCVMLHVVCVAGGVSGVFAGPADPGPVHVAGVPHESDRHEWPLTGRALTGETLGLTLFACPQCSASAVTPFGTVTSPMVDIVCLPAVQCICCHAVWDRYLSHG